MSMLERQRNNTKTRIVIKDSGVYKFESSDNERQKMSAVGKLDFNPQDFLDSRNKKWQAETK